MNDTRVSFRLPAVLMERLRKIAKDQHRSVSSVCRILVEEAIRELPSLSYSEVAEIVMPNPIWQKAKREMAIHARTSRNSR